MAKSFAKDIAPAFTAAQVQCMGNKGVALADYAYMGSATGDEAFSDHANARHVYARLAGTEGKRMPPGGPYWSAEMMSTFNEWMTGGFLP